MNGSTPQRCVLLTGATGFLGAQVARWLVRYSLPSETDLTIIALVRAENQAAAFHRLSRSWWDWPELVTALTPGPASGPQKGPRVEVLPGDVSLHHLGLDEAAYALLAKRITHIIHTAADLRVDAPLDELRKTNLQGTANMLGLAYLVQRDHGLERYAHVSTAYVAGGRSGPVAEADLTGEYDFSCTYEMSKYEGECLVQSARSELPVSVFRPGMIVGASDTGEILTFNTFYFPLRLYLTGKLPIIPADPDLPVNIVPVDYVAEAIVRLTFCPEAKGLNFHLTAPAGSLPRAGELVGMVRAWAREHLGLRLPRPVFVRLPLPQKRYRLARGSADQSGADAQAGRKPLWPELNGLLTYLPYFNERKQFQRDNVDRLLGHYPLNWREFLPRLLQYAVDQGFMHRSGRTVQEQILYRLASKTWPITYHDIRGDHIVTRPGLEVRHDILVAITALKNLGIGPGDRVAIAGTNITRYLTLDVAIGMVGAVSVPLYYTSPPADIDHILAASGARLLFVGFPRLLERLGELRSNLPVISFCHEAAPAAPARPVMNWEAFLSLAGQGQLDLRPGSPAGFGDLATLRYTSGTTGQPKGVMFRHAGVRWMGESLASLLPWQARTRRARYLSFLPLNHVVEGILVTYAGYYLPEPVDMYFLEDFRQVQRYLPQVKPTFFFSVPRVYERAWESLEESRVGRFYLGLGAGPLKNALRPLLRWTVLGKLGLRSAAQLAVGSAVAGEDMLLNFRELGIEIHNSYGLTEAPLVTFNRAGGNRIGTVGTPLPRTRVRIAGDGEVLVQGPQITAGYFEAGPSLPASSPVQDGWLHTGDLGRLTGDGYLVLEGRKKELFKTSYGKYIQPARIEALLRDIPGIAETMVVGEGRPYCVALLWLADPDRAPTAAGIAQAIEKLSRGLSHPEQVKRWAVLRNDLSLERGDLTANLKLKRQAVAARTQCLIEALYAESPSSAAAGSLCDSFLFAGEAARN